jgi:hypothetical protein
LSTEFARRTAEEIVGVLSRIYQEETIGKVMNELEIMFTETKYPDDDSILIKLYNETQVASIRDLMQDPLSVAYKIN